MRRRTLVIITITIMMLTLVGCSKEEAKDFVFDAASDVGGYLSAPRGPEIEEAVSNETPVNEDSSVSENSMDIIIIPLTIESMNNLKLKDEKANTITYSDSVSESEKNPLRLIRTSKETSKIYFNAILEDKNISVEFPTYMLTPQSQSYINISRVTKLDDKIQFWIELPPQSAKTLLIDIQMKVKNDSNSNISPSIVYFTLEVNNPLE